jgi:hypothetical protein
MKNRALSFPAESAPRRWHRERWPWLLIAGPALVVVASLASAWLAIASDDGLVAQDYYKQGLLINRKLRAAGPDDTPLVGATVNLHANGEVRAQVVGLPPAPAEAPARLRLTLAHPGHAGPQAIVALTRVADGEYVGVFSEPAAGRLVVTLESDSWRLPTTTVQSGVGAIELGSVAGHQ